MSAKWRQRLRPIWRCPEESCKYYKTEESALIRTKPYNKTCPKCHTGIHDYCKKHKVFHPASGFIRKCRKYRPNKDKPNPEKRRLEDLVKEVNKPTKAVVIVTPKIKPRYNTRSTGPAIIVKEIDARRPKINKNSQNAGSERQAITEQTKVVGTQTSEAIKCGMCLRQQVKDFCNKIPGCANNDHLCMVCYPRWLNIWHQQSKNKKTLPCPICCTGVISWDAALDPYRQDFIVMSTLQK